MRIRTQEINGLYVKGDINLDLHHWLSALGDDVISEKYSVNNTTRDHHQVFFKYEY